MPRHAPCMLSPVAFAICLIASGAISAAPPVPITNATISREIPKEVVDGDNRPVGPDAEVTAPPFQFFDDFSWRSFISLMWPARPSGARGEVDTTRDISDASGPRVWETWKSAFEAIPPKANVPTAWTSFDGPTPCSAISEVGSGRRRVIGSFTKFGDISQALFGDLAGPLVCRNNTYVHYEIKVNKEEFETIVDRKMYDRVEIDRIIGNSTVPAVTFKNGSIEVKAAWREFKSEPEEVRKKYYRINAAVQNYATGTCETKELGLIGFHIVQKTPLRPQWVWSSFEHIDNVPEIGTTPPTGTRFTLNDPGLGPISNDLIPDEAPGRVTEATYLTMVGDPFLGPMNVVRKRDIPEPTKEINRRYREHASIRDTVWANYILVLTQWPRNPAQASGSPFPGLAEGTSIANTTMETYFQNDVSCMACHNSARARKMDFVFFPFVHASRQDPGPPDSPSHLLIETLRSDFNMSRQRSRQFRQ